MPKAKKNRRSVSTTVSTTRPTRATSTTTRITTKVSSDSSLPKTPKRRTKKQAEPEIPVTDEASWPASRVPVGRTICKTYALDQYKLTERDVEDVLYFITSAVTPIHGENSIVRMKLYQERDIERTAWRKHGGPERFEAYLNKRRTKWFSKPRKGKWAEPTKYGSQNSQGPSVQMLCPPPGGLQRDKWAVTPELVRKKACLRANGHLWLWDKCNRALDNAEIDANKSREAAFFRIIRSLEYPPRPLSEPPTSASFDALREVLNDAPVAQGEFIEVEGIEYDHHGDTSETSLSWVQGYLDRLFTALIDVIEEHGLGGNGWKRARWMVYDTYSRSFAGFWYDDREGKFVDEAYDWLSGWIHPLESAITTRMDGSSEVGKAYNKLLPKLSPGQ